MSRSRTTRAKQLKDGQEAQFLSTLFLGVSMKIKYGFHEQSSEERPFLSQLRADFQAKGTVLYLQIYF